MEKNSDRLHSDLEGLMQQSWVPFVQSLYPSTSGPAPAPSPGGRRGRASTAHPPQPTAPVPASTTPAGPVTIAGKFKGQLVALHEELQRTQTHYIR
jgi:myosin heavy subunit